ncbi:MAG: hypothetical protein IPP41_09525 [Rhodocyclaceae bacterium]|nr:hypothetical protein [Rhodocyclaceae bacterium]
MKTALRVESTVVKIKAESLFDPPALYAGMKLVVGVTAGFGARPGAEEITLAIGAWCPRAWALVVCA